MTTRSSLTCFMSGKRFLRASDAVMDMPIPLPEWYNITVPLFGGSEASATARLQSRAGGPAWWKSENFVANLAIAAELTDFARSKDATLAQLALAWLLAKKGYIVPIPGSRSPQRVEQNAAADLRLTADDLDRIAEIAPDGSLGGRLS